MASSPQPHRLKWPLTPSQVESVDEMLQTLYKRTRDLDSRLTATEATSVPALDLGTIVGRLPFSLVQEGDEGERGPQGPQGIPGTSGIIRHLGLDGDPGEDGIGWPGQTGATGPAGPAGSGGTGTAGPWMSPGDVEEDDPWPKFAPYAPLRPLHCSIYNSGLQAIAPATNTSLNFDSEDEDTGNMHDNVTNNSRITIPADGAGIWLFYYYFLWAQTVSATQLRQGLITKNGAQFAGYTPNLSEPSGAYYTACTIALTAAAAAGDYFEIQAFCNAAANVNVGNATRVYSSTFTMFRLSGL